MKTAKRTSKTLDALGKYPFGTGLVSGLAPAAESYLSSAAFNGINEIFSNNHPNADGNMFNYTQGGQILAFGGGVGEGGTPSKTPDPAMSKSKNYLDSYNATFDNNISSKKLQVGYDKSLKDMANAYPANNDTMDKYKGQQDALQHLMDFYGPQYNLTVPTLPDPTMQRSSIPTPQKYALGGLLGGDLPIGKTGGVTSGNYTPTKNPNVVMGKYGVPISMDDYQKSIKNGMPFNDFDAYANWVGGWAKPIGGPDGAPMPVLPKTPIIPLSDKSRGLSNTFYDPNGQRSTPTPDTVHSNDFAMGGIVIKPSHKGRFTAWAKDHHMSISEAASHVMANKGTYSKKVVKMANFAKNFAAMGDLSLQPLNDPQQQLQQNQNNVPVEVEGGEVAQTPNGQMGQFQGPTHEEGGIPANLPQGTKIFSNRLAIDGKSMQARKLSREKSVGKMTKLLDGNPTDTINRNTYNRTKNFADMEEQQDLAMQDAANQIYSKVPQLQGAESGFQTPIENNQEQYQQLGDMGQVQGTGVPRTFATGTGTDGVPGDPYANFNWSNPNNMVALDDLSRPTPNFPSAVITPTPISSNTQITGTVRPSTDMPYTTGDKVGFAGNALSAALPLATTIANRAGDRPNVNAFQNFGKNAIEANTQGMGEMGVVRDEQLKNLGLQSTAQRNRNRNSATSVNTSRALDLATSGQEDASENSIYSNYASQMAGMYNERSKLSNQQDLYTDTGAQTANRADRMDRDSYYGNLGQNLSNVAHQTQQTGKEINEHDYNNQILSLMPYLNKYGLGFTYDENGNINGMSKIAS